MWREDSRLPSWPQPAEQDADINTLHPKHLLEQRRALDTFQEWPANELSSITQADYITYAEKTKQYLNNDEVKAVMAPRDKIVAQFQKLISEKGEKEVLY